MASVSSSLVHRLRLAVLGTALALICTACRVDVDISMTVAKDGSGSILIAAEADKEAVEQAPNLATDLRFDDAIAAGWVVGVPTPTASGGLQVSLSHTFDTPAQATALLRNLNGPDGPLHDLVLTRTHTKSLTTLNLDGTLSLVGDLSAFADADLLAAIGAAPYADEIARRQLQPADVMSVTFHAKLPGTVKSSTGNPADEQLTWAVPLTGPPLAVTTVTNVHEQGNVWAGPLAKVALGLLIAWSIAATLFILYVVLARRRRMLARSGRLR